MVNKKRDKAKNMLHKSTNNPTIIVFFTLVILLFFSNTTLAQNLIPNPTFQFSKSTSTIHYPNELQLTPLFPENWRVLAGEPDFFNTTESTYLGYSLINSLELGGGKLGMRMTNVQNSLEAVETNLKKGLEKGKKYKISFQIAHYQHSPFSMNLIPFVLSNEKVNLETVFQHKNIYYLETTKNYLAADGWRIVSCIYEAKGGEKYFTLLSNTTHLFQQKSKQSNSIRFDFTDNQLKGASYYFFNQIKVELAGEDESCSPLLIAPKMDLLQNDPLEIINQKLQFLSKLEMVEVNNELILKDDRFKKHYIFLIDYSGSMKNHLENVKKEALEILSKISDHHLISLVVFSESSSIPFNRSSKIEVSNAIRELSKGTKTNVSNGLKNLNALISPSEFTTLEIFSDQTYETSKFASERSDPTFRNTKLINYYSEYESIPNQKIIKSVIDHLSMSEEIASTSNIASYINYFTWKTERTNNILYSKECKNKDTNDEQSNETNSLKLTNIVYLIDVSNSMNDKNKLKDLKKSVNEYNEELTSDNKISLVSFSGETKVLLNSIEPRDERFQLIISNLEAKGSTKINDGINFIYNYYLNEKKENISLILFTDGLFQLSEESKKIILRNPQIHFTIFQLGDKKNRELASLTSDKKLMYMRISSKEIKGSLVKAAKEFGFPSQYSEPQPKIWKYFQNNLLEITGYLKKRG